MPTGGGFRYPYDINTTLPPWRESLGENYEPVVAILHDRDRALEDWTSIVPAFEQVLGNTGSITSTTPVSAGGPEVTIKIPRGLCTITSGALAFSSATNNSAVVDVFMDGAFLQTSVVLGNNTGGSLSASLSSTVYFDNLVPGSHTFELRYWSSDGTSVDFEARFLHITPVP